MPRRALTVAAVVVLLGGLALGVAHPAHAAAYRYWTYWQGQNGSWAFASAGPASTIPPDGSVEGWRFAVTTQAGSMQDSPSTAPDFAAICGSTPQQQGTKRVALVIDPGPASIAPEGQTPPAAITTCVVADEDATGYQVLRSVATVRTEDGLICAVADYPTGECAPVIDDPAPASSVAVATSTSASSEAMSTAQASTTNSAQDSRGAPWVTGVVVVAVAAVAIIVWRRRA